MGGLLLSRFVPLLFTIMNLSFFLKTRKCFTHPQSSHFSVNTSPNSAPLELPNANLDSGVYGTGDVYSSPDTLEALTNEKFRPQTPEE